MKDLLTAITILILTLIACKNGEEQKASFENFIGQLKDTLFLSQDLKIINIYKDQLAIYNSYLKTQDSIDLRNQLAVLYEKHPNIWGESGCLSWSEQELIAFNEDNAVNYYDSIKAKAKHLIENNIDSVLSDIFTGVSEYSGHPIKGQYYPYFMHYDSDWFDMGGCDINTMQINLNHSSLGLNGIIEIFPHELNHQIYEVTSENDENYATLLWGIIDEGFATYFERSYNNSDVLSALKMNEEDYKWCLDHEQEIYQKAKPLFFSTNMEDEQKLRGNQGNYLIEGAPARLNYFLGYRIVEQYVKVNGSESWRDVYTTPVMDILSKSKYESSMEN